MKAATYEYILWDTNLHWSEPVSILYNVNINININTMLFSIIGQALVSSSLSKEKRKSKEINIQLKKYLTLKPVKI